MTHGYELLELPLPYCLHPNITPCVGKGLELPCNYTFDEPVKHVAALKRGKVVQEMNFIKKKIKGSKKGLHDDDDDFDPNQFFPPATRPEGAPKDWVPYEERLDEQSEEWLAYKQLTSRITETLQKTQDNLTKIVAHSTVPAEAIPENPLWPGFEHSSAKPPPPRPPPPNNQNAAPPRPPPPASSGFAEDPFGDLLADSKENANGFGFASSNNFAFENSEQYVFEDDDDDDYGIQPLKDDGVDPFDTSFVDVQSSIARTQVRARPRARDRSDSTDLAIRKPSIGAKRPKVPEVPAASIADKDPFVHSQILGSTQTSRRESLDIMNPYIPPTSRSKSPNPFLSNSPCEPSATNPFLNGSVDLFSVSAPTNLIDEPSCGNPFAAATSNSESVNDFLGPPVPPPPKKRPSLADDLFGLDTILDPFGDVVAPAPAHNSGAGSGDLFDLNDTLTSAISTSTEQKTDKYDFFSAISPPSAQPAMDINSSLFGQNDAWSEVESNSKVQEPPLGSAGESRRQSSQFGSRRDSNLEQMIANKFGIEKPSVNPPIDVFDAFDSIMQPMNTFDGLPPAQPKIRIEIPVELKQNADVFEALGQRGPKTPVEPLTGFDPPTPCPEDSDFFNLESQIAEASSTAFAEASSTDFVDASPTAFAEAPSAAFEEAPTTAFAETSSTAIAVDEIPIEEENKGEMEKFTPDHLSIDETQEDFNSKEEDSGVSVSETIESPPKASTDNAAFDAFEARFQSTSMVTTSNEDHYDPFGGSSTHKPLETGSQGFGLMDEFDPFLSMTEPPAVPQPSPRFPQSNQQKIYQEEEDSDSDDSGPDFSIFIKPKMRDMSEVPMQLGLPPVLLPPPPKSPVRSPAHTTSAPRLNPFDSSGGGTTNNLSFGEDDLDDLMEIQAKPQLPDLAELKDFPTPTTVSSTKEMERMESQESLGSVLFDEDDTEPLEDFPPKYEGTGWAMVLRQPNKKKITGQRFWKKVFVRLSDHVLHLFNSPDDKDPFQELPLQACYSVSEISAQQFDQYGKIFTLKLQYVFYRERVGVRPGQITKVAQGQITSFGQLAKLGLPLEHAPQVSQLLKLGCQDYTDLKVFARQVEDALFHIAAHRDRALTYKTEEIQVTVQDETYCDVAKSGHVNKQLARVRVFFLAFISGMPDVEVGLNDLPKKGKEVVGRYDIIPVVTEEWIRLENLEFHTVISQAEFDKTRNIKFHPPDACFFELLRFRVRPPKVRELPLQVKSVLAVDGNRIELRIDVLVPGYSSRKHGQVPCEDISFRYLLPECWIYLFRVEKHFRYGSLKSASRKPGKIKGLERLMGATQSSETSLIEVSTGQAKYEHHHRSIVWRVPRLPKEGQGAYTEHSFVCRFELTSYDQMPEELDNYVYVEFTMPACFVSHTTVRSVSVSNQNPPEKHVRYISKCEYRVEVERVNKFAENVYVSAAAVNRSPQRPPSSASSSSPHI
uniref:MHD domain-containing protein n=1 Tax=Strigamia maritima TaxID=126957 RepID=T1JEA4_STRMM